MPVAQLAKHYAFLANIGEDVLALAKRLVHVAPGVHDDDLPVRDWFLDPLFAYANFADRSTVERRPTEE